MVTLTEKGVKHVHVSYYIWLYQIPFRRMETLSGESNLSKYCFSSEKVSTLNGKNLLLQGANSLV